MDVEPDEDRELAPREDVVAGWRGSGFELDLDIIAGGAVRCPADGAEHEPEAIQVDREFRYEGVSDPEDEELLLAVSLPCGHRGVIVLAYGAYAEPDQAELARRLPARSDG